MKALGITTSAVHGLRLVCAVNQKKVPDKLMNASSVAIFYRLSEHIGCVATVVVTDARLVAARTRQIHRASGS